MTDNLLKRIINLKEGKKMKEKLLSVDASTVDRMLKIDLSKQML